MRKLICVDKDLTSLAKELFPTAKAHMRVEHTRDDQYILDCVVRAINEAESYTGISIHLAVWHWYETSYECCKVPKFPVRFIEYPDGTVLDENLVVGFYGGPFEPVGSMVLGSGVQAEYLQLLVGYPHVEQIPPQLVSSILALAGSFYENRESVQLGNYRMLPDAMSRLFTGIWRPSV